MATAKPPINIARAHDGDLLTVRDLCAASRIGQSTLFRHLALKSPGFPAPVPAAAGPRKLRFRAADAKRWLGLPLESDAPAGQDQVTAADRPVVEPQAPASLPKAATRPPAKPGKPLEPVKRGPGRPKGSKTKPKAVRK